MTFVVDTSALMAVVLNEKDAQACVAALAEEMDVLISAGTYAEALVVAARRGVLEELSSLVEELNFEIAPVTEAAARRVAAAYERWGKGLHPAGLNFGDCFAYELAQERRCNLLYVGDNFSKTDIQGVLMPDQPSFAGFEPQPRPLLTDRLFFAIFPDAEAAATITRTASQRRSEVGLKGRPLAESRFHITLNHLGDYAGLPAELVKAAITAGDNLTADAFDVAFDRAMSFTGRPGNRPFVLRGEEGLADLIAFQRLLVSGLVKGGAGRVAERGFTPHVTLLYDSQLVAEAPVRPIAWRVREFVLVHSLLGQTKHVILRRWGLNDQ